MNGFAIRIFESERRLIIIVVGLYNITTYTILQSTRPNCPCSIV